MYILRVPEWALDAIKPGSALEEIANSVYSLRAQPKLVRIRSGFLIKSMLEHFEAKINDELDPDIVLFMYSAHSSTITTLLNGLGLTLVRNSHQEHRDESIYTIPCFVHFSSVDSVAWFLFPV